MAYREWLAKNTGLPEKLLTDCPERYRRWDWHFLNRLCHRELLTLQEKSRVTGLAFRSDGRRLATISVAGLLRVYE